MADHPNYEEDEEKLATSIPIAKVDHLVKYVTGEVPEWGEPWWSVDHVSDFIIPHLFRCYLNVHHGVLSYFHFYSGLSRCG